MREVTSKDSLPRIMYRQGTPYGCFVLWRSLFYVHIF